MGLFDKVANLVIPATIGFATGGPVGAFAGAVSASELSQAQRKAERQRESEQNKYLEMRGQQMFIPSDISQGSTMAQRQLGQTNNAGFGSSFGNFIGDFGQNILNPLSGLFSSVRPFISQQSQGQPALPSNTLQGGRESQTSGTNQAFIGGTGNLLGQAARFLGSRTGQISTGVAGGIVGSMFGGQPSSMRITRKMKAQYRAVLNLNMGNYEAAADMIGVSTDMFVMVLLKRFRNDGPVVTKAALRKTRTTVRRLKSMCDMYDSLRPSATRRKTPMKRASTTLISNK
tara:strand:+ start:411 stop:1271 length:861 start_codon:yes stop_codon:yes gene_type:complete